MAGLKNATYFKNLVQKHRDFLLRVRRHLHQYPELSFQEIETSAFIAKELRDLGFEVNTGVGGYGLFAYLDPKGNASECISLRADIDALPIVEETGLPFSSKNQGVMHACGHDGHASMLLTAALILSEAVKAHEIDLPLAIQFLFQPAEEKSPGGAQAMIAAGAFSKKKPRAIFGQHINPSLKSKTIGTLVGVQMASVDDFTITIEGKGGHGASPHLVVDPVVASAHIITGLQTIVSRNADPQSPTVLSFGSVIAQGAHNIIPDSVVMCATLRTFDPSWRTRAKDIIVERVSNMARAFQCSAAIEVTPGYPMVINDNNETNFVQKAAEDFAGVENTVELPKVMWAEDFAYYANLAPSCFYNLGISTNPSENYPLHNSKIMLDEEALVDGAAFLAYLAYLRANS